MRYPTSSYTNKYHNTVRIRRRGISRMLISLTMPRGNSPGIHIPLVFEKH